MITSDISGFVLGEDFFKICFVIIVITTFGFEEEIDHL